MSNERTLKQSAILTGDAQQAKQKPVRVRVPGMNGWFKKVYFDPTTGESTPIEDEETLAELHEQFKGHIEVI